MSSNTTVPDDRRPPLATRHPALDWTVLVNASGGWRVLAAFADEGAAWAYGGGELEARVRNDGTCLGHKVLGHGLCRSWGPCDETGPCMPEGKDEPDTKDEQPPLGERRNTIWTLTPNALEAVRAIGDASGVRIPDFAKVGLNDEERRVLADLFFGSTPPSPAGAGEVKPSEGGR